METDENGNILIEYIYLNGQLLAIYTPDDDQDGIVNQQEAQQGTLPINTDSDGDGLTNLTEWYQAGTDSQNPDSDGDGILDGAEIAAGTNPNQNSSFPGDGDINENGEVNAGDLVLLTRFVLGYRTPTPIEFTHADMNQDGQLNVADILLLQRQILQAWLGIETGTALAKANINRPTTMANTQATPTPVLDWLIAPAQALPNNNGFLYYAHLDPLGTPQALTDESGAIVWIVSYDPFGKATVDGDPDNDGNLITFNARLPGQYYDQETGLHYNYFRYYDPSTGRFLTSDPIGLDGGLNTYLYANANPVKFIDPTGELFFALPAIPAIAEGVATAIGIGVAVGIGASIPATDQTQDRSIPIPKRPGCGCTCNCRADANDNIPGNIRPGDRTFAFGSATAKNCAEASKQAKRNATRALGKQPKHVGCRCAGK